MFKSFRRASASEHLNRGRWSSAIKDLTQQSIDQSSPKLSAYLGLAYFYSADFTKAADCFSKLPLFKVAAEVEDRFPNIDSMRAAIENTSTPSPWLSVVLTPADSLESQIAEAYRVFSLKPNEASMNKFKETFELIKNPSLTDLAVNAQTRITFGFRSPSVVSAANALSAAEALKKHSPEGLIISAWYISHALILHGRIAAQQGNAVLAEGLFDAAKEQASEGFQGSSRQALALHRATKEKAQLLLKWDKRENEGVSLMESLKCQYDQTTTADASELFIPPPSKAEIDRIYPN